MRIADVIILAPLSALSRRTRLFKLARYLLANNKILRHVGWERLPREAVETHLGTEIEKKIILRGGGYGGRRARIKYPLWMMAAFCECLRIRRGQIVWALGFESAFPAALASKIRRFRVVFDDADRFSLLFPLPAWTKKIVTYFEMWTSRNVAVHLIPGAERYDFQSPSFFLLRNMPSRRELDAAKDLYAAKEWPQATTVVNINGWLGSGRGLGIALEAAQRLLNLNADVRFILAGKIDCDQARQLSSLSNVMYLGEVSNAEALASYLASDYVFTYYRPGNVINRYAESNKWGDAIKTGVGVIVNSEVETAKFLRDAGAAISVPYDDVDGLCAALMASAVDPQLSQAHKAAARQLGEVSPFFEDGLELLFKQVG